MRQLAVLAVGACEHALVSAQIVFRRGLIEVRCGRTYAEAAAFLSQNAGAVVICEEQANSGWRDAFSHLIHEGRPSALMSIAAPGEGRIGVELRLIGNDDVLLEFVRNPEAMRKVLLARDYCKAAAAAIEPIHAHLTTSLLM